MTAPILYVEDEEDYQLLVKRILSRAGLDVVLAETGEEAFKIIARERPSLLILDINLPDTDGYSICNRLRQDPDWTDLPILMLTVRRRPEEWLRGFSSGANDYISKPLNPPELIERVVSCLEGKAHPFTGTGSAEYNLIQAAVAGNRAAFEVLIQKYRERLLDGLRTAGRHDAQAEDAVANAFVIAFETLREFRGEASFYTWVYRIAMNEITSVYRKPSTVSLDVLSNGDEGRWLSPAGTSESLENTYNNNHRNAQALEALESVQEPYRQILQLYFLQDLSYEAIARKLRIPQGTVMSRLFKARKLLQNAWRYRSIAVTGGEKN